MPIRRKQLPGEASLEEIFERGYFDGLAECRKALEILTGGEVLSGSAFGISWPWARLEGALVAPGIPVRLFSGEEEGPDGVYRFEGDEVLREAAGEVTPLLECTKMAPEKDVPLDLLCFGAMERYLLQDGLLTIEDLFCRLELPVSRHDLDRILIRGERLNPALIEDLPCRKAEEGGSLTPTLSIARPAETQFFPEPDAFFGMRADVRKVSPQGDFLKLESHRGDEALFRIERERTAWSAEMKEGRYPLAFVRCSRDQTLLHIEVRPSDELQLLAPGKRGRLAFDLHSDCVLLARSLS